MKKYLTYIAITATILAMSGCSSDSTEASTASTNGTTAAGQTILVYPGDTVTPLSEATRIEVQNIYEDGYSRVTVLSGSVNVTRQ